MRGIASWGCRLLCLVAMFLGCSTAGCGGSKVAPSNDPEAKQRLEKVLRLYQAYVDKNKKGPTDERSLREVGQKMSTQERSEFGIGNDVDQIFTSPRDKQKYVIQYNLRLDPAGPTRAVAWETTGQGGKRFVALTIGYVEEYDDATFKDYKK